MKFLFFVFAGIGIAVGGLFAPHDYVTLGVFGTSFVAWLAGLFVIVFAAIWSLHDREKKTSRFDMLGAAEIVVVYGIFGLLASLAFGAARSAPLIQAGLSGNSIDLRSLVPLVTRFTEGLFAAGIAPLVAVVLRQFELMVGKPRLVDVVLDPAELEREFKGLELALKGLNREVEGMMTRFGGSADRLASAVSDLNKAIASSATLVDTSGRQLGEALSRGATNIASPLTETTSRLNELEHALHDLRDALGEAVPNTQRLSEQGRDAAKVLDELIEVIGRVRNFIDGSRR
jgi:methyl-accepting chemotaxis protein